MRKALPAGGAHSGSIFGVEFADEERSEMDRAVVWTERFEADALTDEGASDEAQRALPFDVAMRAHAALGKGFGIAQRGQALRPAALGGGIGAGRRLLAERLVRAVVMVVVPPVVGAVLLGAPVARRRIERLGFVAAVHLLVGGVVAGTRPACELDADAQAQPPETQARKAQGAFAAKGRAVVDGSPARRPPLFPSSASADGGGHSMAAEEARHGAARRAVALVGQEPDLEQESALGFAHRERVVALPVGGAEPAFEIDGPHLGQLPRSRQPGMRHGGPAPGAPRARAHQTQFAQPAANGAQRRQPHTGMQLAQAGANLFGTPVRTGLAHLPHAALPARRLLPRAALRAARMIAQRTRSASPIAGQPFVAGLAADRVFGAQPGKGFDTDS